MPTVDLNELCLSMEAGNRPDLPDAITVALEIEVAASERNMTMAAKFLDSVIISCDRHNDGNRYVCAFISVLSSNNVRQLIDRLSARTIKHLVFENEYIPGRSVPIAVDVALRHRDSDREKTGVFLDSLYRRIGEIFPERINEIAPSIILLSNPADTDFDDKRRDLLDLFFESFDNNQLNRIFNKHLHKENKRWVVGFLDSFTKYNAFSERGLLNAFILSSVYASHKTQELRMAISERKEEMPVEHPLYSDFLIMSGEGFRKHLQMAPKLVRRKNTNRSSRLRVAFLLSGQMRGYKEAFASWQESFKLNEIDPVFFIHTWGTIGRKALVGAHAQRHFPEPFASTFRQADKDIRDIEERYPHLHKLFNSKEPIDAGDIFQTYNPRSLWVDEDDLLGDVPNQFKMYYKIQSCYRLAASSIEAFDLVVRLRQDKKFTPLADHFDWWDIYEGCKSGIIFSDFKPFIQLHQGAGVGDQLLVSSPEAAHIISHAWDMVKIARKRNTRYFPKSYVAHATLGAICLAHGYEVRKMPGLVTHEQALCEAAPIPLTQVRQALEKDVAGRNDTFDQKLLQALLRSETANTHLSK